VATLSPWPAVLSERSRFVFDRNSDYQDNCSFENYLSYPALARTDDEAVAGGFDDDELRYQARAREAAAMEFVWVYYRLRRRTMCAAILQLFEIPGGAHAQSEGEVS
jgi:hypothetical protein